VAPGEYIIKIEVAYWPSMQSQLASAAVEIGQKEEQVVVEEGNLIPYVAVKYYPEEEFQTK
jgi:hypothetical protein